ncbi:MAG: hypothetical protein OXH65_03570 [Paracoccaceae bacterium]|nr:hypothetical protein [Paracoccaceae bacterium]MDE2674166.1 hypothetical protein [Paracoccaceae bacterium]
MPDDLAVWKAWLEMIPYIQFIVGVSLTLGCVFLWQSEWGIRLRNKFNSYSWKNFWQIFKLFNNHQEIIDDLTLLITTINDSRERAVTVAGEDGVIRALRIGRIIDKYPQWFGDENDEERFRNKRARDTAVYILQMIEHQTGKTIPILTELSKRKK